MGSLNLMLGAEPALLRDMTVEFVNPATNERRNATPFLDGSVMVQNIPPGAWQIVAKHPNVIGDIVNRPIRILPDRPTVTRITIPANIFNNAAIADTPEANLGPPQAKLAEAEAAARDQARKVAGQPIFAEDWNVLAGCLADTAKATGELSRLVTPVGHDHPELVLKFAEVQDNLQRFYDLFARSLTELQRQIEQLALQRKTDKVVEKIPALPAPSRQRIEDAIGKLRDAYQDPPSVYDQKRRRFGQLLQEEVSGALVDATPEVQSDVDVRDALTVAETIASGPPVLNYAGEMQQRQRTENRSMGGLFLDAMGSVNGGRF